MTFNLYDAIRTATGPIELPDGFYGNLIIRQPHPVHLIGGRGALFSSVTAQSHGVTLEGFTADMPWTAGTSTASGVIRATNVKDFTARNLFVRGPISPLTDLTHGDIEGFPTGIGFDLDFVTNGRVEGCEVTRVMRGIGMAKGQNITIFNNHIHHTRGAMIDGGVISDITIDHNLLEVANPWNWGHGDHADFIHLWTGRGSLAPASNISILRNLLDQGSGVNILGMLLEDNSLCGFLNMLIRANIYLGGNSQGISVQHGKGSILDNTLLMSSGDPRHNAPSIYLKDGSDFILKGNVAHDLYHTLSHQPPGTNTIVPAAVQTPITLALARAKFTPIGGAPNVRPNP